MRKAGGGIGIVWAVLAGIMLLVGIVFVILLGPQRALRIAAAAAASSMLDGFAEDPGAHRIPVLDLGVDPAWFDTLNADLPWSGGRNVPAVLRHKGVEYQAGFRYRGVFAPSHYLGEKRSFRLTLGRSNPFAPYRRLNVVNPKAMNMVNDHVAMWVGGRMGVPVPYDELVFVRINGKDHGVMELREQIDGRFERIRNLSRSQVPVFKGDYAPVTARSLPRPRALWADATHWEYASKADGTVARAKLGALVAVIADTSLTLEQRRDTLAKLIDVDAFLRYSAALLVLNTAHVDQYHNQWLVLDPRTDRFHPVLWDALFLHEQPGRPLYFVHDALAWWLLSVPEWRLQRDRHAWTALHEMHTQGRFTGYLDELMDRLRPSVLADRNKYANVTREPQDVHRFSLAHVVASTVRMRTGAATHWDEMIARLGATNVDVQVGDTSLVLRTTNEVPLGLSWPGSGPVPRVRSNGVPVLPVAQDGEWTLLILREVVLPVVDATPFLDGQQFIVRPMNVTLDFPDGVPASLMIRNAISDEAIQ